MLDSDEMVVKAVTNNDKTIERTKSLILSVNALAKQLNTHVETLSGSQGTTVSITHATFAAKVIRAALEKLAKPAYKAP